MFEAGQIVRSIAGHDKNKFYMLVQAGENRVAIADGKMRKLDKPKVKNIRHIRATNSALIPAEITTDKKLRKALTDYLKGHTEEGGY